MKDTYRRVLKTLADFSMFSACCFAMNGIVTGELFPAYAGMMISAIIGFVTAISAFEMSLLYGEWF